VIDRSGIVAGHSGQKPKSNSANSRVRCSSGSHTRMAHTSFSLKVKGLPLSSLVTSASSKRGYDAYVLAKMSRLQGASGIHVGTMGYGKMEGSQDDRAIAYIAERDSYTGPVYHQEWYGMKPTTPIVSGGMNALRLPGFFENLGHGNVINTAGGGAYGHIDSPAAGAISLRQAYECWKAKADPIAWAQDHHEFARAFVSFPNDADALFPGWRDRIRTLN